MKTTLLLDLDDTLLENDVNVFLPAYLQSFSQYVSHLIPPEIFIQSLITGTQLMMENNQPNSTLKEVFEAYFYQITGVERDEFEILADEFYASIYPELKKSMKVIPAAINLVESAFNRGYRVVIATNPLFPKTAIDQRLSWAGLHRDRFNFELVTTYENSHFAKPNPSYFAEILGKLGWSDDRYLVVGNDLEHDIVPANVLGLPTYWIDQPEISPATELETPMARGGLGDFSAWLEQPNWNFETPTYATIDSMISILVSTPAVLDSLCRDQQSSNWDYRPAPEEWNLTEVMCHLRDVEREVNIPRIRMVLMEDNPFISAEDTDVWAHQRNYCDQVPSVAISSFIEARLELLEMLNGISDTTWMRTARHSIFGRTDLRELVRIITGHDRLHLNQIYQNKNSSHADKN